MPVTKSKSTTTLRKQSNQSARKWIPDKEQGSGVKWLVERAAAALFLDPGMGKTSITYAAITVLQKAKMFRGALVVAPLRPATQVWPAERDEWQEFNHLDVVVLHGKNKDKLVSEKHDVYVINYEGLAWLINGGHLTRLLKMKWVDVLVFDELSKMKNAGKKCKRRKLIKPYLHKFSRRWGLTGSPAANGLINLFGQINILDLGAALGPFITHFKNRFFTPVSEWKWIPKEGAADLIYKTISPVALRMPTGKSVKLPTVKYSDIRIELPPAARKAYELMEDDMLALFDNELVTAATAGALYGKCCQIATGAVFKSPVDPITGEPRVKTGSREWHNVHDEKLDALEELMGELQGAQLLTAYWFAHDLEKLKGRFGKDIAYIGSGISVKRAMEYEAEWNAGNLEYLFGHPMSMGHGLNLQKSSAHHIAWYTPTSDYELYDQFNRRLRRRGNTAASVFVHHIVAAKTVETWGILPSISRKETTQEGLFEALKSYARKNRR